MQAQNSKSYKYQIQGAWPFLIESQTLSLILPRQVAGILSILRKVSLEIQSSTTLHWFVFANQSFSPGIVTLNLPVYQVMKVMWLWFDQRYYLHNQRENQVRTFQEIMLRNQELLEDMETPLSPDIIDIAEDWERVRVHLCRTLWRLSRWRWWGVEPAAPCSPKSSRASPWPRRTCVLCLMMVTSAEMVTRGPGWSFRSLATGEF